jgi:hypothetical protein
MLSPAFFYAVALRLFSKHFAILGADLHKWRAVTLAKTARNRGFSGGTALAVARMCSKY